MINRVQITRNALKQLRRVPKHVVVKLMGWVDAVETLGLEEVRKIPGYHDEPLKGSRRGTRSVRLSVAYRAIYRILSDGGGELVSVEEVTKHGY